MVKVTSQEAKSGSEIKIEEMFRIAKDLVVKLENKP